jgi:hypothetical protein
MTEGTCYKCATANKRIEALEVEIGPLYAAAQQATRENFEMRKRLQSWADDFSPGHPATTDKLPGAPTRPHNN